MQLPAAVLWDMDGTLVDTEPFWIGAEYELAAEYGRPWSQQDALHLVGSGLLDAGTYIRERLGLPLTAEEIVDHLVERVMESMTRQLPWQPGARELVGAFAELGVPQALVTMSYTRLAEPVAEALRLDAVVTGDTATRPKPHPDPYLQAAELLGVDPADCIAVEDSATGAASANAAGCFVVGVPHAVAVPASDRRAVIDTLAGQTPESITALARTAAEPVN